LPAPSARWIFRTDSTAKPDCSRRVLSRADALPRFLVAVSRRERGMAREEEAEAKRKV
jgi:hypothetical protein